MIKKKYEYKKYLELKKKYEVYVNRIATFRLISFLIMIISFIMKYYYYHNLFTSIFIISLVIFITLVIVHDKYFTIYNYYQNYLRVIEDYLKRENGEWRSFKDTGLEFLSDKDNFLLDLDIVGKNSLFQYLSVCKTIGGKRCLFKRLSNISISNDKLVLEQEAIKELASNTNFITNYQIEMLKYEDKNVDLSDTFNSFNIGISPSIIDVIIGIFASLISLTLLGMGLVGIISIKYFYGIFLFNYLMCFMYSSIYSEDYNSITRLVSSYSKINLIMKVILKECFHSKKLTRIRDDIKDIEVIAKKINYLDILNSIKENLLFNFIFNGLFCIGIFTRYYFNKFLKNDFNSLEKSIIDIEEMEAMISLAGIGILRSEKCMPVRSNKIEIVFDDIKHPLLKEDICIPNNFSTKEGVDIITGSNMGGKTSFLRTVGINLVLMNAGTYVCATSFKANYFKIFTSMRVSDDIDKGISTFYGELLRIKDALDYLDKGNMLVLVDEIFKGTNYQDRMYGARCVIKKLQSKGVIMLLTTHDFELCDCDKVRNYHVKEYYEGDKIRFDYKIREGKCSSTNAKYLMEKLGIK